MSEHTAGRLTFRELRGDDGCGYLEDEAARDIAHHGDSAVPAEENRANGHRLVACWNACEELTTEALERWPSIVDAGIRTVRSTEAERDELLKALRKVMEKLRADSGCTDADPMAPFAFDAEWERLALENDTILAKYPEQS